MNLSLRVRSLAAVTASMAISAMVFGFTFPMFSTRLHEMGLSDAMIGYSTSAQSGGVFLVAWFAPLLVTRFGAVNVMLAMTVTKVTAVLLCIVFPGYWPWLALRLVIGAAGSVLWIAGETWINEIAEEKSRGRELAIYSAALGLGTMIGIKIVDVVGIHGALPFLVLAGVVAAAALPLLFVLRDGPKLDLAGHSLGLAGFVASFRMAPLAIFLNAAFAIIFVSVQTFIPIYGLELGLELERTLDLLIVFNLGGIVLPYLAGWLADKIDRALLGSLMVLLCLMLFVVMGQALVVPTVDFIYIFLLGGIAASIYAIALALLGEGFRGAALASATASFTLMWNLGGFFGPSIVGEAMDTAGPEGLPAALAILSALILPFALIGWLRRRRRVWAAS